MATVPFSRSISCFLFIRFISQKIIIKGSIFELTGGGDSSSTSTTLGFVPTAAISAVGLPLSIFLIYAAILKGAAETEEDDAQYNSQNNNRRRY